MRPLDAERHAPAAKPRRRERSTPRDREAANAGARGRRHASRSGRPPALRRAPRTRGGHFARPVRTRDAGGPLVGGGDDVLVDTGELLWLEDSPTVAFTSAGSVNDSAPLPPWRRACAA